MQVVADKYPLSEGMDLSVARQRFYVSPHTLLLLHIHHTQVELTPEVNVFYGQFILFLSFLLNETTQNVAHTV